MKRCWMCNQIKSVSDFWKDRSQWDGRNGRCKFCALLARLIWQQSSKGRVYIREHSARQYRRHPEVWRANGVKRRARKLKATIGNLKAIAKIYARAHELRQWFDVVVDHKIPLSKGGVHSPENLQIIYATETRAKAFG